MIDMSQISRLVMNCSRNDLTAEHNEVQQRTQHKSKQRALYETFFQFVYHYRRQKDI